MNSSELFAALFASPELLLAVFLASAITIILKTAPVTLLGSDSLPGLFRQWLDFIPVAVMAALVGPDIFVNEGNIDISLSNLFLLASLPTLLIAIFTKNYFITIACGIGFIIIGRYYGIGA